MRDSDALKGIKLKAGQYGDLWGPPRRSHGRGMRSSVSCRNSLRSNRIAREGISGLRTPAGAAVAAFWSRLCTSRNPEIISRPLISISGKWLEKFRAFLLRTGLNMRRSTHVKLAKKAASMNSVRSNLQWASIALWGTERRCLVWGSLECHAETMIYDEG